LKEGAVIKNHNEETLTAFIKRKIDSLAKENLGTLAKAAINNEEDGVKKLAEVFSCDESYIKYDIEQCLSMGYTKEMFDNRNDYP